MRTAPSSAPERNVSSTGDMANDTTLPRSRSRSILASQSVVVDENESMEGARVPIAVALEVAQVCQVVQREVSQRLYTHVEPEYAMSQVPLDSLLD